MNIKELKEELLKVFEGQGADSYKVSNLWSDCLKDLFKKLGCNVNNIHYEVDRFSMYLYYCESGHYKEKVNFMRIDCKRAKGQSHYRSWYLGGSYTDYTWKGFDVYVLNDSLWLDTKPEMNIMDGFNAGVNYYNTKVASASDKFNELYQIYKALYEMVKPKDCYDLNTLIGKLDDNRYELKSRFMQENAI